MNKTTLLKRVGLLALGLLLAAAPAPAQRKSKQSSASAVIASPPAQWVGKRVAYLGDSMTDKRHIGTDKNYWQYLQEMLDIEPFVYGINGNQWHQILPQAQKLHDEVGDNVDAIFILAGTNDYNASVPLGEWYNLSVDTVTISGPQTVKRLHRTFTTDNTTFRGRINNALSYLKATYPDKQIILLTPIHRGYAKFSDKNIQPDESYSNAIGLFIDDYVRAVKEAANVWAVTVIDLNSLSGIMPSLPEHTRYISKEATDRLHPSAEGHERMARAIAYQLMSVSN
jgi:lysophospholipase L1-like esterase